MPKRDSTETNSIALPGALWGLVDDYCLRHDVNRSYAIRKAARLLIATETAENPQSFEQIYQDDECNA